ncbi:hypothetical protein Pfo_012411 [Paulownia fortunei]|nr:hypothetical protein Pfo_012411 [Paulownia fortunei]
MEQSPRGESRNNNHSKQNNKKSKRMPSPQELVAHYEKQGMETQEASLKVIQDLQGALFRMITANRKRKSPDVTSAKLDAIHSRLLHLEMKIDSKPSYPQALALGVASAGIWNAAVQLWNSAYTRSVVKVCPSLVLLTAVQISYAAEYPICLQRILKARIEVMCKDLELVIELI